MAAPPPPTPSLDRFQHFGPPVAGRRVPVVTHLQLRARAHHLQPHQAPLHPVAEQVGQHLRAAWWNRRGNVCWVGNAFADALGGKGV